MAADHQNSMWATWGICSMRVVSVTKWGPMWILLLLFPSQLISQSFCLFCSETLFWLRHERVYHHFKFFSIFHSVWILLHIKAVVIVLALGLCSQSLLWIYYWNFISFYLAFHFTGFDDLQWNPFVSRAGFLNDLYTISSFFFQFTVAFTYNFVSSVDICCFKYSEMCIAFTIMSSNWGLFGTLKHFDFCHVMVHE